MFCIGGPERIVAAVLRRRGAGEDIRQAHRIGCFADGEVIKVCRCGVAAQGDIAAAIVLGGIPDDRLCRVCEINADLCAGNADAQRACLLCRPVKLRIADRADIGPEERQLRLSGCLVIAGIDKIAVRPDGVVPLLAPECDG